MKPLLPLPIEDEHALSLLNAYLVANAKRASSVISCSHGIYQNSDHKVRSAKVAGLFSGLMPLTVFLELHGFVRLNMYRPTKITRHEKAMQLVASAFALKFCPECRRNDIAEFGYVRLRRTHQVSGVIVCPDHGCFLLKKCSNCDHTLGEFDYLESGNVDCPDCGEAYLAIYPKRSSKMRMVAQFYQAILDGQISARAIVYLPDILKELAQAKFGASVQGIAARLRREVEEAFPQWFLVDLGLSPRDGDGAGWIRYFCAGLKFTDCLHAHALIGAIVFSSIQEWIDVYAEVGRQHLLYRPVRAYHQIPLSAELLRDLAQHDSFAFISKVHCVTKNNLHWVIANVPGLQRVRNTSLIRGKLPVINENPPTVRAQQELGQEILVST